MPIDTILYRSIRTRENAETYTILHVFRLVQIQLRIGWQSAGVRHIMKKWLPCPVKTNQINSFTFRNEDASGKAEAKIFYQPDEADDFDEEDPDDDLDI